MEDQERKVKKIMDSYAPHERTKYDELKELDRKVRKPALIFAYAFGTVAALILGVGMCFAMKVIGASVMSQTILMTVGVIIGCIGIALCIGNYFIYGAILKSRKKRYGGQILTLSNELTKKENDVRQV